MAKNKTLKDNPGLVFFISYLLLYGVNALTIYLAYMVAPAQFVLGTYSITPMWAVIYSATALTLIGLFLIPFVHLIESKRKQMFTSRDWMLTYFLANFVGLWLITRIPENLGLGISSWMMVALLAAILDLLQGFAMMALEKIR